MRSSSALVLDVDNVLDGIVLLSVALTGASPVSPFSKSKSLPAIEPPISSDGIVVDHVWIAAPNTPATMTKAVSRVNSSLPMLSFRIYYFPPFLRFFTPKESCILDKEKK
jgi:hypothetical protein